MVLKRLVLHNFRNYTQKSFDFSEKTTYIVGPNTTGKTNILEAVYLLSTGKSFRAEKDSQLIQFGEKIAKVSGIVSEEKLECIVSQIEGREAPLKKYIVNGVSKRRADFASHLHVVLFSPLDLDIISGAPGLRRAFLDEVLEQSDTEYRLARSSYEKALRQRNALLDFAKEKGIRNEKQFEYWDELLIENGQVITKKRNDLIQFFNDTQKDIVGFVISYNRSEISKERLLQYKDAEVAASATLVGPHRDDILLSFFDNERVTTHDVKQFGSRGQQRLIVLQLKLLALGFIEEALGERPLLLLDDIFSELDEGHIHHVRDMIGQQQTIITTTHQEFISTKKATDIDVIELKKA